MGQKGPLPSQELCLTWPPVQMCAQFNCLPIKLDSIEQYDI